VKSGLQSGTVVVGHRIIENRKLDGRADVYALGCVLYECLTGIVPFERETDVATLYAHMHDPAPTTRLARPDIPAEIDAVFAKTLAKSPGDRFQTCAELMQAARRILGTGSGPAAIPGPVTADQGQPVAQWHNGQQAPAGYAPPPPRPPAPSQPPGYGQQGGYGQPPPKSRTGLIVALAAFGFLLLVLVTVIALVQAGGS
jgi:serine/threonine protein kinase